MKNIKTSLSRIGMTVMALMIMVPVILLSSSCVSLLLNSDDYIKIDHTEGGESFIQYGENVYYDYEEKGTGYTVIPSGIDGTQIGFTLTDYGYKRDVFLLNGSGENIIAFNPPRYFSTIWLKEGYMLPDLFDAEIGQIYYRKSGEDITTRTYGFAVSDKRTLKDLIDREKFLSSLNTSQSDGAIYFRLANISSLEIFMRGYVVDSDMYIEYIEVDGWEYTHYFYRIKEEFRELLINAIQA